MGHVKIYIKIMISCFKNYYRSFWEIIDTKQPENPVQCVGASDRGVLNQPVNVNCVPLVPDGDAKRHKVYTGSGNRCPTSSLRERSCIPCTEVLVVGVYKLSERGS